MPAIRGLEILMRPLGVAIAGLDSAQGWCYRRSNRIPASVWWRSWEGWTGRGRRRWPKRTNRSLGCFL